MGLAWAVELVKESMKGLVREMWEEKKLVWYHRGQRNRAFQSESAE